MKCLRPAWLCGLFLTMRLHSPTQPSVCSSELEGVLKTGLQGQFTSGKQAQNGEVAVTGPEVAGLGLEPGALLSQCTHERLPQGLSGSRAENASFVPAQSPMLRRPLCSESPNCHRERGAGLPAFLPTPLPAVEPFVLPDLCTTARLLTQKALCDWERATRQSSSRWGLSQPELGGGPIRLISSPGWASNSPAL